jgi:hypothetical protein
MQNMMKIKWNYVFELNGKNLNKISRNFHGIPIMKCVFDCK